MEIPLIFYIALGVFFIADVILLLGFIFKWKWFAEDDPEERDT